MSQQGKRILIVGAGASGLTAIKCCLDEGLEPVCFEIDDTLGGLWNYKEETATLGKATVMKSTIINTSKETMAYSDFPPPANFPVYMHNIYVVKYLRMYAEKFDLLKYIQYFTEVTNIEKANNFACNGQWKVYTKNKKTDKEEADIFDGVLICSGHHAMPNIPSFSGLNLFKGRVLHSQLYKHCKGYEDKRVLIVGIGNSGGDIAAEVSSVSSQVFLSTRRGAWIINRVFDKGLPVDMCFTNRFNQIMQDLLPESLVNFKSESQLNHRFDHELYSLKPKHSFLSQHPMINDALPNRIISGCVRIKPDIRQIKENGVEFVDGTFEDNIDIIVLATGYHIGIPFISDSIIDIKKNQVPLFKLMFPPDLEKNTLALIGCAQAWGAIMPISEIQCRLAVRVFRNAVILPPANKMWEDITKRETIMKKRYVDSIRHTVQVDFISYMDEIAELNGCKPNLLKMFLVDPPLATHCFFSTCTSYQYRLEGPGKWPGAKDALYGQWDRTLYGIKQKKTVSTNDGMKLILLFVLFSAFVLKLFL